MITNHNTAYPGSDHGLGFEINQKWYMGGLAGPRTVGHTGFTGTSLVIDFHVSVVRDPAHQPGPPRPGMD